MRRAALLLLLALPLFAETPVATILCYHEVDAPSATHETIPRKSASGSQTSEQLRYTASVDNFRAQLDYLEANGYHVIPLAALVDHLNGRSASLPPRAVVITVDDGWACAFSDIAPELQKRGMPWTLFVYPKIVGRGSHAVTWDQLTSLAKSGVDVQSHSFTHPFLTMKNNKSVDATKYDAFLGHELLDSKQTIEKTTGKRVRFLCFPFGDYDENVIDAAKRFGYEAALTTERGVIVKSTPPMKLKRYLIHNDTTIAEFKTFLLP